MDVLIVERACETQTARGLLDTEFFHAPIEGLAADAELARGLRHDLAVLAEHAFDRGAVEHRLVGARRQHGRQVQRRRIDRLLAGQQRGALQHVAQLAHIARPAVIDQRAFAVAGETLAGTEEGARDRQDVVAPFGQRRQGQLDHRQPVEQVLAEAAFAHAVAQRHVGRGDDAHVGLARGIAAQPLVLAGLQHAQ
jgi:hypothetical protein